MHRSWAVTLSWAVPQIASGYNTHGSAGIELWQIHPCTWYNADTLTNIWTTNHDIFGWSGENTGTLLYTVVIAMQHVILAYHNKMRRHIASEPCTH